MMKYNLIGITPANLDGQDYLELTIDGIPLPETFVGRLDANPDNVTPIGWSAESTREKVSELLLESPPSLASGRIPVLVCKLCGDCACGCFAVRVTRDGNEVYWNDWAYEDSCDHAKDVEGWKNHPRDLVFEWTQYEAVLRGICR